MGFIWPIQLLWLFDGLNSLSLSVSNPFDPFVVPSYGLSDSSCGGSEQSDILINPQTALGAEVAPLAKLAPLIALGDWFLGCSPKGDKVLWNTERICTSVHPPYICLNIHPSPQRQAQSSKRMA